MADFKKIKRDERPNRSLAIEHRVTVDFANDNRKKFSFDVDSGTVGSVHVVFEGSNPGGTVDIGYGNESSYASHVQSDSFVLGAASNVLKKGLSLDTLYMSLDFSSIAYPADGRMRIIVVSKR